MADEPKKPLNFAAALRLRAGKPQSAPLPEPDPPGTAGFPREKVRELIPALPTVPTPPEAPPVGTSATASSLPDSTSLVKNSPQAYFFTSLLDSTSLPESAIPKDTTVDLMASLPESEGYTKLFNQVVDFLYPQLDPAEQAIHLQLYRLSWGYNKSTCIIGLPKLGQRSGMSSTAAQQAVNRLIKKGLIKKIRVILGKGQDQGVEYWVAPPPSLVKSGSQPESTSLVKSTTNKDHDHDHDLKDINHHRAVMTKYLALTGKKWSRGDTDNYRKIEHIPLHEILDLMETIKNRSAHPIGSFAYFARAVLREKTDPPQPPGRKSLRKKMQKLVEEVRNLRTGANLPPSEFAYEVKIRWLKEGLAWDDDLFNDVVDA